MQHVSPPGLTPLRIEYEGATYHVMARWNHGQAIYEDEQGRKVCQ